ncbi:hypothetical protein K438DRAFT_1983947 [Mycena galopus ATCC 62051]|nr:hypothetical protein K438DRAFT_1983947 [Mycena galopus ATCC 62051]
MPPRRATTPPDDDDFRALMEAMVQASLTAPAVTVSKRSHDTVTGDDSDGEEGAGVSLTVVSASQNIVAATKLYANKKRLSADQVTELEQFANTPPPSARSSSWQISLLSGMSFASKPSYEVSADLNICFLTNVAKYTIAILLSNNITTYKGDAATDALMVVVKKLRFDLPPGLENIPTHWAKVVGAGQYALTQRRSKVKKVVRASLKPDEDGVYAPNTEHQNIYDLAQTVFKDTQCKVTLGAKTRACGFLVPYMHVGCMCGID